MDIFLLVDRYGHLGRKIISFLKEKDNKINIVFATADDGVYEDDLRNVVVAPFKKRMLSVPKAQYSHMLVVLDKDSGNSYDVAEFSQEAEKTGARLIFVLPIFLATEEKIQTILSSGRRSSVAVIGEVYGEGVPYVYGEGVFRIFHQASVGKIILANMGLDRIYPVFIDDAAVALDEILFKKEAERVFYLFPKNPPTHLTIARILHKKNPLLKIDFSAKPAKASYSFPVNLRKGKFIPAGEDHLESRINKLSASLDKHYSKVSFLENHDSEIKKAHSFSFKWFFAFIVLVIVLPIATTLAFSFAGATQVDEAKKAFEKGSFSLAKRSSEKAVFFFSLAEKTNKTVEKEAGLIGRGKDAQYLSRNIALGKDISSIFNQTSSAAEGYMEIISGASSDPGRDFTKATNSIKSAIGSFGKLSTEDEKASDLKNKYGSTINMLAGMVDALPSMLGMDGQKVYLVLFQNNMELRPGGGFIGSYGLATVNKGRILDFAIHDVYDADGQLKGHVEPPYAIRRHIPSQHWYMRDSNFSFDFVDASSQAAYFLELETGHKADGVLGVDVSFVKSLLKVIGPVYIPSYDETVTDSNLYILTQTYAQKDFFPGSRQKKDFLSALFSAIQVKMTGEGQIAYPALFKAVVKAISEKHILVSSQDQSLQKLLTANSLSSAIADTRKEGKNKINDFLGISEANVGGNKANVNIFRKVSYSALLDNQGVVSAKLTISYKNTSKKGAWPGGQYKNYLRLILPQGASLTGVNINGTQQQLVDAVSDPLIYEDEDFAAPQGLEIEKKEEAGKTVFGFLTTIVPEELATIIASYILPYKISTEEVPAFSYSLVIFKQPGTQEYPFSFSFDYPQDYSPFRPPDNTDNQAGRFVFSDSLAKDLKLEVDFVSK